MPLGLFLTGCGATPSNEVRGVFFDTQIDNETGLPVFYVDIGRNTELSYKVNPSSWSGYKPVFQILQSGENEVNRTRFDLTNGTIIILSPEFDDITVQIVLNDFTDTCIVKLKKYPEKIFFENGEKTAQEYISANSARKIHVYAQFSGEEEARAISDDEFRFNVVSSDSTIINVPNSSRLFVSTIKSKPSVATVTIDILNADGKPVCEQLKLTFDVLPLIDRAYLILDGYDHFINSDDEGEITIHSSSLETDELSDVTAYLMNYKIKLFGQSVSQSSEVLIEDVSGYQIKAFSSTSRYFKEIESGKIKITPPGSFKFDLTVWVGVNDKTVSAFTFSVTINFVVD